jgi:hypothetical protein
VHAEIDHILNTGWGESKIQNKCDLVYSKIWDGSDTFSDYLSFGGKCGCLHNVEGAEECRRGKERKKEKRKAEKNRE